VPQGMRGGGGDGDGGCSGVAAHSCAWRWAGTTAPSFANTTRCEMEGAILLTGGASNLVNTPLEELERRVRRHHSECARRCGGSRAGRFISRRARLQSTVKRGGVAIYPIRCGGLPAAGRRPRQWRRRWARDRDRKGESVREVTLRGSIAGDRASRRSAASEAVPGTMGLQIQPDGCDNAGRRLPEGGRVQWGSRLGRAAASAEKNNAAAGSQRRLADRRATSRNGGDLRRLHYPRPRVSRPFAAQSSARTVELAGSGQAKNFRVPRREN